MLSDLNKGITAIAYNYLPEEITFGNGSSIEYIYNAAGVKVMKTVNNINPPNVYTDYLDGFQYVGGMLNFFPTAEGYVRATSQTEDPADPQLLFNYVYNYTDHLGNIRLSYTKDLVSNELEILDESHYYPFGLKHNSYDSSILQDLKKEEEENGNVARPGLVIESPYNYKYNGKEFQDELGLGLYDYGWRNYDPALGRWMNIDPLAETSRKWSPYTYTYNNPLRFIDPDGMQGDDVILKGALKDEAFSQLQSSTNLDLKMNENGKLSASGTAVTDADKVLEAAINNENVIVEVNTTSSNYNDNGQWIVGESYEGSTVMAGGTNDGKTVAEQTANPNMTKEMDSFYNMGEGTTMLHGVLEAYVGAVTTPGAQGFTAADGNPLGYQEAHDTVMGLDPRYVEPNIIQDSNGIYMSKQPYDPLIPKSLNPEKLINNLKKN